MLRCVFAVVAVLTACFAASAQAAVMFTTDGTAGIRTDAGFTIGNQFTVGSNNIVVTGLGIWDGLPSGDGSNGLNFAHEVGVWDASNTLLTSATVPAGTAGTLFNEVRYTPVATPIVLQRNTTYWMGGLFATGTDDPFRNNSGTPALSPDFTVSLARYNNTSGVTLLRPTSDAGAGIYFGPNMEYTVPVAELTSTPVNGSNLNLNFFGPTLENVISLQNTGEFGSAIDITGFSFSGPDGALFELIDFAPITLTAGFTDEVIYDLGLDTSGIDGTASTVLTIMTSAGDISFNISAVLLTPEPNSLALASCGLIGLMIRRRRLRG